MKKLLVSFFVLSLAIFSVGIVSASNAVTSETYLKTITLEVDDMTCNMCPITVKRALRKVDGVKKVSAKYEGDGKGWAKVTFDTRVANVNDLTFSTEKAGYPSRLKE